jgi:hypothetical protein
MSFFDTQIRTRCTQVMLVAISLTQTQFVIFLPLLTLSTALMEPIPQELPLRGYVRQGGTRSPSRLSGQSLRL